MLRPRTEDLASRGPRNLRSRGTLPPQYGAVVVKTGFTRGGAVLNTCNRPSQTVARLEGEPRVARRPPQPHKQTPPTRPGGEIYFPPPTREILPPGRTPPLGAGSPSQMPWFMWICFT